MKARGTITTASTKAKTTNGSATQANSSQAQAKSTRKSVQALSIAVKIKKDFPELTELPTILGDPENKGLGNFQFKVELALKSEINNKTLIAFTTGFLKNYYLSSNPVCANIGKALLKKLIIRYQESKNPLVQTSLKSFIENNWRSFPVDSLRGSHSMSHLIVRAAEIADIELLKALSKEIRADKETRKLPSVEVFSLNTTISDAKKSIPKSISKPLYKRINTALDIIHRCAKTAA